jgi:hypothetical protein
MPVHDYTSEDGETISVYVAASAPTTDHQTQTRDGKVYKRVYSAPLAAANTSFGDCTAEDFARKTAAEKRGLKVGDAWEISAEMSDRRRQRDGIDLVKERYYEAYEKEHGEKHADVTRRERIERANAKLADMGIKINL